MLCIYFVFFAGILLRISMWLLCFTSLQLFSYCLQFLQHDKWLLSFLLKTEYIKFPFLCSFLLFFYHCDNVVLQEYCWVLYLYLCTNVYSFKYPFMFAFIYIFILDWYVVHCRYFVVVYYLSIVFEVIIFIPTATLKCLNESFPGIIKIRFFIFFTKFLQIFLNLN